MHILPSGYGLLTQKAKVHWPVKSLSDKFTPSIINCTLHLLLDFRKYLVQEGGHGLWGKRAVFCRIYQLHLLIDTPDKVER